MSPVRCGVYKRIHRRPGSCCARNAQGQWGVRRENENKEEKPVSNRLGKAGITRTDISAMPSPGFTRVHCLQPDYPRIIKQQGFQPREIKPVQNETMADPNLNIELSSHNKFELPYIKKNVKGPHFDHEFGSILVINFRIFLVFEFFCKCIL